MKKVVKNKKINVKKESLTIGEVVLKYKNHFSRDDRWAIDSKRFFYLIESDHALFRDIDNLRENLKIKKLDPREDIKDYPIIYPRLPKSKKGSYSFYWKKLSKKRRENIEKNIYKKILCKWKLNFNFYSFVMWYLLYKKFMPIDFFEPSPIMYEVYRKYPMEFIRTPHTTSDIKYMVQEIKLKFHIFGKPNKEEKYYLDLIKEMLSINKNKERRLRNPEKTLEDIRQLEKYKKEVYDIDLDRNRKMSFRDIASYVYDNDLEHGSDVTFFREVERLKKQSQRIKKIQKIHLKN